MYYYEELKNQSNMMINHFESIGFVYENIRLGARDINKNPPLDFFFTKNGDTQDIIYFSTVYLEDSWRFLFEKTYISKEDSFGNIKTIEKMICFQFAIPDIQEALDCSTHIVNDFLKIWKYIDFPDALYFYKLNQKSSVWLSNGPLLYLSKHNGITTDYDGQKPLIQ